MRMHVDAEEKKTYLDLTELYPIREKKRSETQ